MIDPLRSLGIEKGKQFNPDVNTRAALEARRGGPELEASLAAIVPASVDGFAVCDDPLMVSIMPRLMVLAADRSLHEADQAVALINVCC